MKKGIIFLVIFLLALIIILVTNEGLYHPVPKADYINQHPGQSILPYPWEPGTSIRVLPFNYDIPAAPSNNLSVTACRGEFEAASFLVHAQKDLSGITITPPTLSDGLGHSIPSAAIDIRLVKVWYQAAANDVWLDHNEHILAPELLLKDDSLVSVDYVNRTNYLRVTLNGTDQYIDISSPDARVPPNAQIHDTPSLQPFSLKADENKQVWLTVHVPDSTPAGKYYGNIVITTPAETPVLMNFSVSVEPFDLAPAPLEYGLYYRGMVSDTIPTAAGSEWKTAEQYAAELQDMKDHGVLYPTLYQEADSPEFPAALQLRNLSGLPTDHIYIANGIKATTDSSPTALNALMIRFQAEQAIVRQYGFTRIYVYGVDEGNDATLLAERPSMTAFRNSGAGIFVACYNNAVNVVGDLLDVPVVAGALKPALAAQWQSNGKRIFSYANPQVGIENPEDLPPELWVCIVECKL